MFTPTSLVGTLVAVGALAGAATTPAQAEPRNTWYVSATARPGGDGGSRAPFDSLADAERASRPDDTIIVLPAPASVPPLDGGIALKPGQRLLGGGPGRPGWLPRVTNTGDTTNSGDAVVLANRTEVADLVVDGSYHSGIYGLDVTDVRVHDNDVSGQNTSGTIGFSVSPTTLPTYTPGASADGVQGTVVTTGRGAIMIDATTVHSELSIKDNFVHDGTCGNGIDVRAMDRARLTADVAGNRVTRLVQCAKVKAVHAITMQATGTATLRADLDGNTQTDVGSPGANAEGLFVNTGGSGSVVQTVRHNTFRNGVGGHSTNGLEIVNSNGDTNSHVLVQDSTFRTDPGDMLELYNWGVRSTATLVLDRVSVADTTISGGLPPFATPPGTAVNPFNNGACLDISSGGAHNETVVDLRHSQLSGCGNNAVAVTNNHVTGNGVGDPHSVRLDIDHSRLTGSGYYNLWVTNLTPLDDLAVSVQDSDLSSAGGVGVGFDQRPTGSTGRARIDLGGGPLGSAGRNCLHAIQTTGYDVSARHNWWGSPSGPSPAQLAAGTGTVIDTSTALTRPPAACAS